MVISFFLTVLLMIALLIDPNSSILAAKSGLLLWFNKVIPSLLPFMILSNILILSGGLDLFKKAFSAVMKPLFKLPGSCFFPWIIGLISGYPSGAKVIATLQESNQITSAQSQKLMSFCNNAGPFFIVGTIGIGVFSNRSIGYFLLFTQFLTSLIIGVLYPIKNDNLYYNEFLAPPTSSSIGEVLSKSVNSSMEVITQVGGYIILFSVISTSIQNTSILKYITLHISPIIAALLVGSLELTTGIFQLNTISMPLAFKVSLISSLISWGGVCVHAQSLGFFSNIKVNTLSYLFSKFLAALLAFVISFLLFPFFL